LRRANLPTVRRVILLLGLFAGLLAGLLVIAGCGSSQAHESSTTTTAAAPPGPGQTLYAGGPWAVVLDDKRVKVFHQLGDAWRRDASRAVKIRILGPTGTAPRVAQLAAEISATQPLVESALWVDGVEVPVKGGGSATKGTIYGALGKPLTRGSHVAVAYGRTAAHGSAVAWSFRVG
jgi:hypothetical protein